MSQQLTSTKNNQSGFKGTGGQNGSAKKPLGNFIKVGIWALNSSEFTETEPPEDTESLFNGPPGESVLGGDGRKPVSRKDLMPGGKYRAIVKLFLRFAGQPAGSSWAMATGWLIEKDLLVTAGHCVYDWSHNYGKLTHLKAYIGYSGKDTVLDNSQVQLRMGVRVATTESWLIKGANNSRGDVAFVRVNKPFTGVIPINYSPTPSTGSNVRIGVVGYPGDLMKKSTKEKGALMYEMFLPTDFTITNSKVRMLQYTIDTYGGNSGSPVLRGSDMRSIGVHVLGGNPNSASVIEGKYGNSFAALKTAIGLKTPSTTMKISGTAISYITVPKDTSAPLVNGISKLSKASAKPAESESESFEVTGDGQPFKPSDSSSQSSQLEDFQKALKKAMSITASPFGAIAAYGLYTTCMNIKRIRSNEAMESTNDAESHADETSNEAENAEQIDSGEAADEAEEGDAYNQDEFNEDEVGEDEADITEAAYDGVIERALLTDAAFDALVQIGPEKCKKLGYLKFIASYVSKHSRAYSRAGRVVLPHFMAPMFRTVVQNLKTKAETNDTEADTDTTVPYNIEDPATVTFGPRLDASKEAIIEALMRPSGESLESWEAEVDEIISKGLRIPGPLVASVASTDLVEVFEAAESSLSTNTETDLEAALENENSSEYLYDALAQRALLGEAMLESIMNAPLESQLEEGIFSKLKDAVGKLGKFISKTPIKDIAPWVSVGMAAYTIGKDIYKVAKPKKKKEVGQVEDAEAEDGEAASLSEANGWESFFA